MYCSTPGDRQSVISILRDVVIRERDLPGAESQLLELPSLKRFSENLKSAAEKDDFRRHMRRYLSVYLPDCPFEIFGTNQYPMKICKATIIARKMIKAGEEIKCPSGIRAISTEEEVTDLIKKDVALVLSSRLGIRPLLIYLDRLVFPIMTANGTPQMQIPWQ
jgi:hypothetical protein